MKRRTLTPGSYVFLLRLPGYEDVRVFVAVNTGTHRALEILLYPAGTTRDGWVRIVRRAYGTPDIEAWMMEREVTVEDYLVFLNDPATLAELDRGGPPRLVPRGPEFERGFWTRGEDGRFSLPETWRTDWPVIGVSWDDAHAYVRWISARRPPPLSKRWMR